MALETLTSEPEVKESSAIPTDPYTTAMAEYAKQKSAIIATQNRLMQELENRRVQPADKLMAFSQAMLTPGRTGNFGEAFGGAMGALQKTEAEEIARSQALAKMRMELGMQQLGLAKDDIELAKKKILSDSIRKTLSGAPQGITGPQALGAAQAAGLRNGPTVEAASIIGQEAPSAGSIYRNLDPATRSLIEQQSIVDPEAAQKSLISFGMEAGKTPDAVKAANYWISALPPEVQGAAKNYFAATSVYGNRETAIKTIIDINQAIRDNKLTPAAGNALIQSITPQATGQFSPAQTQKAPAASDITVNLQGSREEVIKQIVSIPDEAERNLVLSKYLSQQTQPEMSQTDRERLEFDRRKRAQEQEEKEIVSFKTSVMDGYKSSGEKLSDANALIGLTAKSPNIFGYFTKPTVQNAVTSLLQGGIFGLKVPEIKDALLKFGATPEEVNTLRSADYISIRQQLTLGQQMKGPVSNFERELVGRAVITPDDSVNVVRWKANIIKARAMSDREIYDLYRKNPNMTEFQFMGRPEYQEIKKKLDDRLVRNNKAYGIEMEYTQ